MNAAGLDETSEIHRLAFTKMSAVLGPERARQLVRTILDEMKSPLTTAQDLFDFSERLARFGGFESAVGAMLGVAAVMRGAGPNGSAAS